MKNSPKQLRVVTRPRSGSSATAKIAPLLSVLGCLVALLYAVPAQAQTRTWVSGVGDDANRAAAPRRARPFPARSRRPRRAAKSLSRSRRLRRRDDHEGDDDRL